MSELSAYSPEAMPMSMTNEGMQSDDTMLPPDLLEADTFGPPLESFVDYNLAVTAHYQATSECMVEQGWPEQLVEEPNTPMVSMVPTGWEVDRERFVADFRKCYKNVGPFPGDPLPTVEQAEKQYQIALDTTECLRKNGIHIGDVASKQKILDDFMLKQMLWSPQNDKTFLNDPVVLTKSIAEIYKMCPW